MAITKKKIIPLEVRDEYILGSGVSIGAAGSFDSAILRIKFDESWLGLNIYATWMDALGNAGDQTVITVLDLVDGEPNTYDIPVPQFATNYAGTVKLALSGYVIGGEAGKEVESLLNTVSGAFRVLESNAVPLDGGNTAASVAEQLLDSLNRHEVEIENRVTVFEGSVNSSITGFDKRIEAAEQTVGEVEERMTVVEAAEKSRAAAEIKRANAETTREGAESQRLLAEEARIANELKRQIEEDKRHDAELYRVGNENARLEAEARREALAGDLDAAFDELHAYAQALIGGGNA